MLKLLLSVFALTLVGGALNAEPLALEPEAEPQVELAEVPEDLSGVESVDLDRVARMPVIEDPETHGAYIERVDLSKCQHYKDYLPYFYAGMVVNSRGWMVKKGDERFTSMAILKTDGSVVSSTSGAWPAKKQLMYHTWEMLHFGVELQDIRTTKPGTLKIQSWNAGQQIYVPLYMADMEGGRAYMLHIYPEPSFLADPADYTYADGLLWAKGNTNRLYKFDIDLEGLIRNATAFNLPNYKEFITPYGVVKTNGSGSQSSVVYSDVRHIDVHGLSQSSATNYICRDSVNTMDLSWTDMEAILKREMTWL